MVWGTRNPPRGPCKASVFLVSCRANDHLWSVLGCRGTMCCARRKTSTHLSCVPKWSRIPRRSHVAGQPFVLIIASSGESSAYQAERVFSSYQAERALVSSYQAEMRWTVVSNGESSSRRVKWRELFSSYQTERALHIKRGGLFSSRNAIA